MRYNPGLWVLALALLFACEKEMMHYDSFADYPVYEGTDLGLDYSPTRTTFKLWAPPAQKVKLHLYDQPLESPPLRSLELNRGEKGVWSITIEENLLGQYYAFQVYQDGHWLMPVPDPYVKAVGTNGQRGHIIDFSATDPAGWSAEKSPPFEHKTDAVIYEVHVRDLSVSPNSGIQQKGKFLGFTEAGTRSREGVTTGLDHLRELGVTHVHLLPSFDFYTVDESKSGGYNWGYDPQNYNVPEGSYSSNPADGAVRVREFKEMVKALHENGIRVILDVVYNHTGLTGESHFNQIVPGYYYRQDSEGGFSNASGCGNETASERFMMRKFMKESVRYWMEEYHIDGFRFDLMGIHDIETMNEISAMAHDIDPAVLIYGEGWTGGASPLADEQLALKKNIRALDGIAAFSDDMRDAIKGHVFTQEAPGFINGSMGLEASVMFGVVAATEHPQINYDSVNYSSAPWAKNPTQAITYCAAHDNLTLWDKLAVSTPNASEAEKKRMAKLAAAMILTAQGIPFIHAGQDFLRTKGGNANSYKSPDSVNQLDWSRKAQHIDVFNYYKGLISLRKNHPAFRVRDAKLLQAKLEFLETAPGLVAYHLKDHLNGDSWSDIVVVYNGNRDATSVSLPAGAWSVVVDGFSVNEAGISMATGGLRIPGSTCMVLRKL